MKEILNMFPLKAKVTSQILHKSDIFKVRDCIGANTLKSVLPKGTYVSWGVVDGFIRIEDEEYWVTTSDKTDFMGIQKPREVEFILRDPELFAKTFGHEKEVIVDEIFLQEYSDSNQPLASDFWDGDDT